MMQLSKRLQAVAAMVPLRSRLADIGTDHALLPIHLVKGNRIQFAVAGENKPGPWETARRHVQQLKLEHRIAVRRGDGLAVLSPGEVDCVTIAGMGGGLIVRILESGRDRLQGVETLVLQPNVGADLVRGWLRTNEWRLDGEQILEDQGRIYEILLARKATSGATADEIYEPLELPCGMVVDEEVQVRMGPHLLRHPNAAFIKKWRQEIDKLSHISASVRRSSTAAARRKFDALQKEIRLYSEVLSCIQRSEP